MNQSPEVDQLSEALAKAQAEIQPPVKNKTVKVRAKSGAQYSFKYATFDSVVAAVKAPFAAHGLSFSQGVAYIPNGPTSMEQGVVTILRHVSGQWVSNFIPLQVQEPGMQALGSGISYAKRYGLDSIAGVVSQDDDDGNSADGNSVQEALERPISQKPTQGKAQPVSEVPEPSSQATGASRLKELSTLMKKAGVKLPDLIAEKGKDPRKMTDVEVDEAIKWVEDRWATESGA